jgi:quercetin dioxygenase-like cupin family protein
LNVTRIADVRAAPGGSDNFVGQVPAQVLVTPDQGVDVVIVSFSPGARTYLHTHTVPQVLYCTEGRGILATEHQRNEVGPGDVVYVPAGEMHWHGAAEDSDFTHVSIRPPGESHWTDRDPLAQA